MKRRKEVTVPLEKDAVGELPATTVALLETNMKSPNKRKSVKKINKVSRKNHDLIEFDNAELALLLEAVKKQIKSVEEERFYRRTHPEGFYNIYLERYWRIVEKLDRKLPKAIFIKMPKF